MNWLLRLLRRDRLERELDAELQFHVDRLVAESMAAGLSETEARRRAVREFGALELVKDDCRRVRGTEWLRDLIADARIGLRVFTRERGFTFVAVAALALGLGVNTVFFSLVKTYCLTGLPYASASELFDISVRDDTGSVRPFSLAQARAIAELPRIERAGYHVTRPGAVRTQGSSAKRRAIAYVSEQTLPMIGETPSPGRAFRPEEYRDSQVAIAIVSAELAIELFGSETVAVGREVLVDGVPLQVVGVFPASEKFPDNAAVWRPLSSLELPTDAPALTVFARLKTGTTAVGDAAAEVETALRRSGLLSSDRHHALVIPLNDRYRGRVTDPAWIAFITAGALVVLIACANVSNLLLARGVRRHAEIATRLSLGATRGRIVRQLLTETFVLAMAACVAAAFISWVSLQALRTAIPPTAIPYWASLDLDWRTIVVLLAAGIATVVVSGMAPALQLVKLPRVSFNERTTSHGKSVGRWSSAFLIVQISVSVLLLCAVGMTVQVYRTLMNAAAQTRVAEVLSAEISLTAPRYATPDARRQFLEELRRELLEAGPVISVSLADALPGSRGAPRSVTGGSISTGGFVSTVAVDSVFFDTLGLTLLSGRAFTDRDHDAAGSAVVVNDRFARLFFGDASAIGQQVHVAAGAARDPTSLDTRTIVGVVRSLRPQGAFTGPPLMYVPRPLGVSRSSIVLMRGVVPPQELAPILQEAVARANPDVPLSAVLPLEEAHWQAEWNGRLSQALITAIASVGLCLAMVGVAALTAHRIATRGRELSIRVALGATPGDLLRTVLGPVMVQLLLGLVFGALLAQAWHRVFGSAIAAADNFALVAVLVSLATLVFSAWPARRAARADPIAALRSNA